MSVKLKAQLAGVGVVIICLAILYAIMNKAFVIIKAIVILAIIGFIGYCIWKLYLILKGGTNGQ